MSVPSNNPQFAIVPNQFGGYTLEQQPQLHVSDQQFGNITYPEYYNPQFSIAPNQFGRLENQPQFQVSGQQFGNMSYPENQSSKRPRSSEQSLNLRMLEKRSKMAIPFKTELCLLFKKGNCSYGDNCHFAHGIQEIQGLPSNKPDKGTKMVWWENYSDEDHRIISKMKLCRKFCNGEECPYGDRCTFLHVGLEKVKADLGLSRKSVAIRIVTSESGDDCRTGSDELGCHGFGNSGLDYSQLDHKQIYWKTKLCNKWESTGNCSYGVKCYFAHGEAELHKIGSHIALESGNVPSSKALIIPANDTSTIKTEIVSTCKQQRQGKKCLFKHKEVQKISRIYADWI